MHDHMSQHLQHTRHTACNTHAHGSGFNTRSHAAIVLSKRQVGASHIQHLAALTHSVHCTHASVSARLGLKAMDSKLNYANPQASHKKNHHKKNA